MHAPRHIVCTTYGSLGDLHPYLALGSELAARGHRVTIATSACYEEAVNAVGLGFRAVRPDAGEAVAVPGLAARLFDPIRGPAILIGELLMPHIREMYDDLTAACQDADVLVSNTVTLASPLVAEKLGVSWAAAVLAPVSLLSAYDPSVLPPAPGFQKLAALGPRPFGALTALVKRSVRPVLAPWHALRAELGLPATRMEPLFDGQFSPTLNLAAFSPVLGEPQPDWPANTVQTGFLFYDGRRTAPLDSDLAAWLDDGEPPIVFTLGSAAVTDAGTFYQTSAEAARRLGRRALLLTGRDPRNRPEALPSREIAAVDYAPYGLVFPRCAAIVHQGGIGTTAQALRAGRPMLVVPFGFDQPDNAARCVRIGVARTLERRRYRVERVVAELEVLLGDEEYAARASAIGGRVASENGAVAAANALTTGF